MLCIWRRRRNSQLPNFWFPSLPLKNLDTSVSVPYPPSPIPLDIPVEPVSQAQHPHSVPPGYNIIITDQCSSSYSNLSLSFSLWSSNSSSFLTSSTQSETSLYPLLYLNLGQDSSIFAIICIFCMHTFSYGSLWHPGCWLSESGYGTSPLK